MTPSHLLGLTLALAFSAWAIHHPHTPEKSANVPSHESRSLYDPLRP